MSKLPQAPLQEAIFEMRWPLQPDATGRNLEDRQYDFALGKFQDALKETFPFHVSKFPSELPHRMLNYQTMHQFWQDEKQWPVVQLGPGIATVNDSEQNYEWKQTYLPNIEKALSALMKSYNHLSFHSLSLRYIDVVKVEDYGFSNWSDFVSEHINFQFNNDFNTRGELIGLNFEQSFSLKELGYLNLNFSSGQNDKKEDIFIWQTAVSMQGSITEKEVLPWLNKAHDTTSALFKEICKKEFYGSFSK